MALYLLDVLSTFTCLYGLDLKAYAVSWRCTANNLVTEPRQWKM